MCHAVFELSFSDGTFWVVRVRFPENSEDDTEEEEGDEGRDTEIEMLSEIATLRLVSQKTSMPVAEVFGYERQGSKPF